MKGKAGWQRKQYTCIGYNSGSLYKTPGWFWARKKYHRDSTSGWHFLLDSSFRDTAWHFPCSPLIRNHRWHFCTYSHCFFMMSHSHSLRPVFVGIFLFIPLPLFLFLFSAMLTLLMSIRPGTPGSYKHYIL